MFNFLGRLAVNHPWKIVGMWLLAAFLVAKWAPAWDSKAHDDDVRFLPERCRSVRAYLLLKQAFPKEVDASQVIFAVERSQEKLRPADFELVNRLVAELSQLRQGNPDLKIGKIVSYQDALVGSRLTSDDGQCTLVRMALDTPYLALQTQATVNRTDEAIQKVLKEAGPDAPEILTTGYAGIGRDLINASGDSLEHTTLATVILVIVILLMVYRAPLLALVPLISIAISVFVALRLLALMTLIPGIHLVNISQIFAIVILYGAGTDYCLFLVSRYREELQNGYVGAVALRRSVRAVGGALAASAGTVICGLSLMGFAEFAKVRCVGPAIGCALSVALVAALTLTPALLRLLGPIVFWPGKGQVSRPQLGQGLLCYWMGNQLWDRISRLVVARPLAIWAGSLAVLLPLVMVGLNIEPAYRPTAELSPQSPSIRGMAAIQRHFIAGETGPLTVLLSSASEWDSPDGKKLIEQISKQIGEIDNVAEVRSLTQPLGKPLGIPDLLGASTAPAKPSLLGGLLQSVRKNIDQTLEKAARTSKEFYLARFQDRSAVRHVTRLDVILKTDPFDLASKATLESLESWLAVELPKSGVAMGWVDADYYGVTVHSRDLAMVTQSDQKRINVLVLGGIFLILLAIIRRVWLAAYLLVTVLLSYYATLGMTALISPWWTGQPVGQLDWRVPFFLFTILAAVGEDYNILLVDRILKERRRYGATEGTRIGLSKTGGTITACGLIMAGTFATLMFCGLNTLVQVGFALAFGVLLDTFLIRTFLVPAFLLLVWGKKTPPLPTSTEAPRFEERRAA